MQAPTPPTIETASLPDGTVGQSYSQTLTATGGQPPYSWSVSSGSFPGGLSLSGAGAITGTPTAAGTSTFTVQVAGSDAAASTTSLSITIDPAPVPTGVTLGNGGFGTHSQFGNLSGGSAFADVCSPGSAIYRFSGRFGGNIDQIRGHCAPLVFAFLTAPFRILRGAADEALPNHGLNLTTPFDVACPADEFLVGISGQASGGGVHDLRIHCASLDITGSAGTYAIAPYGIVTTLLVDGGNPGAVYSDLLNAPKLVDRYRGRAGAWIDAIGIGDAEAQLVIQ